MTYRSNDGGDRIAKLMKKALREQARNNRIEASALFRKILGIDPSHLDAHYFLGTICAEARDYDRAKKHLGIAHQIKPDSPMVLNNLAGVYRLTGDHAAAATMYEKALALNPNLVEAHRNLGFLYAEAEQYDAAIRHFLKAAIFLPNATEVLLGLAHAYIRADNLGSAEEYFKQVLALKPDHAEARHLLDAITGAHSEHPPQQYVTDLFDNYADRFDEHLVRKLEYRVPELLRTAIVSLCGEGHRFSRVVDLGCGTGLAGEQVASVTGALIGVDLSAKMLARAKAKGIYAELHHQDIAAFLATDAGADLYIAADVLIYLGDLEPYFSALGNTALPGARFVFSVEKYSGDAGFVLKPTGRYAHSIEYLQGLADKHGFLIESIEADVLRREKQTAIDGYICCFRARAG